MTQEARQKLKNLLVQHEDYKQFPYTDITGHLTIGIGRNLFERGVSPSEALWLLDDDIFYFTSKLSSLLNFFDGLDDNRKIVLIDMCFNLGINGFLGFNAMLAAIQDGDFEMAAHEIFKSKAAQQCPKRYERLAYVMQTGAL